MTEELTGQPSDMGDTAPASDKADHMVPKARLDEELAKRRNLEAELEAVAASAVEDLPEAFRALVPNVTAAEKVRWIKQARAAGLFKPAEVPTTDDKPPKTTPRDRDVSNLPPHLKIAAGYGTKR